MFLDINVQMIFEYRTVLNFLPIKEGKSRKCVVECVCGSLSTVEYAQLKSGRVKKCRECWAKEKVQHGMSGTKEYRAWQDMWQRCSNKNNARYKDYGGRGITICPEWSSFDEFLKDVGVAPKICLSIDRIENDGDYEPKNCKWSTKSEQQRNKRNSHRGNKKREKKCL